MLRTTLLLMLLCSATIFAGLDRPAITDTDEAFYAEAGREMLEGGDWLTPHYNHDVRFQKPILFYWLVAGTYRVLGVSESAARAWPALSGLGLSLLAAAIARRWYDESTARVAGSIVATAFGYFSTARIALPDLPLAFTTTLATWAVFRATLDDGRAGAAWWTVAGMATGAGLLLKGPVAVIVVLLATVPALWLERRSAIVSARGVVLAAAVALLVATPWYARMVVVHGDAYVRSFFVADNVERFATTRFNTMRPPWFYLPILAGGLLPWTPLVAAGTRRVLAWVFGRIPRSTTSVRLALWTTLPLLFFTVSIGKQPRYILPILPPLAVLLARVLSAAAADRIGAMALRVAASLVGLFLVTLGLLLFRLEPLLVSPDHGIVLACTLAMVAAGAAAAVCAWTVRPATIPVSVALAAAATLCGLHFGLTPRSDRPEPVELMAEQVVAYHRGTVPVATYRAFVRNLTFYTGLRSEDLSSEQALRDYFASPGPVLCVLPASELEGVQRRGALPMRTLASVDVLDAAPTRLRALFAHNPAQSRQRVLLVTNR